MATETNEALYFEDFDGAAIAVAFHHAASATRRRVVVMAHGFHGNKSGGSRHFVDLARELSPMGICTLRFDQPGSGDSANSFEDASFDIWVATTEHFANRLNADGYAVAILGESMGGNATMAAAAKLGKRIRGMALWSPDPMLDAEGMPPGEEWMEESGQRVRWNYWREAGAVNFIEAYRDLEVPVYAVFGTADHHISFDAMRAFESACKPGDQVRIIDGLPHSAWPDAQRQAIFTETRAFFAQVLGKD